jgi:hypothetical protein
MRASESGNRSTRRRGKSGGIKPRRQAAIDEIDAGIEQRE